MDGTQFDSATRALPAIAQRRGVLGLLFGGALGLAGLAGSEAKGKKGKGKGKGKGKKKDKKRVTCVKVAAICGGSSCGEGDVCCAQIDCDCRKNLYCNRVDAGDEMGSCGCMDGDVMHNGRCGSKPDCIPAGQKRGFFDVACCSGNEVTDINDPANGTCLPGVLNCLSDADCTGGSCRGWFCAGPELDCNIYYQ